MGQIIGGPGDDLLVDRPDGDAFIGDAGFDIADFSGAAHAVRADLSTGVAYKVLRVLPFGDSITHGVIANRTNWARWRWMWTWWARSPTVPR